MRGWTGEIRFGKYDVLKFVCLMLIELSMNLTDIILKESLLLNLTEVLVVVDKMDKILENRITQRVKKNKKTFKGPSL